MTACTFVKRTLSALRRDGFPTWGHRPDTPGTEGEQNPSVRYLILVHQEGDALWAEVSGLPGCFASGDTLAEALACVAEAIELWEAPSALSSLADG